MHRASEKYSVILAINFFGGIAIVALKLWPRLKLAPEVLSFGFGVAVLVLIHLLAVLLIDVSSRVHTVIYDAHKQAHKQEQEIKVLPLSSNRKQLRYRDRSNIFGQFSNGMAEIILEKARSNFGRIGGCLAHEMIG